MHKKVTKKVATLRTTKSNVAGTECKEPCKGAFEEALSFGWGGVEISEIAVKILIFRKLDL